MSDDPVETLFRVCRRDLQTFFRRRVGTSETAADLTQETFLRFLRAGSTAAIEDPKAYLFRTAANLVTDHYRSAGRRRIESIADSEWQAFVDSGPSPESVVLSREELQILMKTIAELPPRGRQVFELHRFEGLTYAEISDRLGIAKNTVMVHMARSLTQCKRKLDEYRRISSGTA